jgi:hypothetical protein
MIHPPPLARLDGAIRQGVPFAHRVGPDRGIFDPSMEIAPLAQSSEARRSWDRAARRDPKKGEGRRDDLRSSAVTNENVNYGLNTDFCFHVL